MIRQIKDLRNASIIRLQPDHLGSRMPFGKTQYMLYLGPPPRVDALRIVSYRHDLMVPSPNCIHKV